MRSINRGWCLSLLLIMLLSLPGLAHDWPGFRGPDRDGRSSETNLLHQWPADGPSLIWEIKDAGLGFSNVAIVGDRMVTMGMSEGSEWVICYSLKDGQRLWTVKNGPEYKNSFGDGPRATPQIDGEHVYALGASGDLCCLKLESGQEVWRLNILKEFEGQNIQWGISESPLVEGELLIVTPGGKKATVAALNKRTGQTAWTCQDPDQKNDQAGYASIIAYTVGSRRQMATFTSVGAFAFDPKDGKFMWRYNQVGNRTANITTPIHHDGHVFFTSDYGTGCALIQVGPDGVGKEVYFNKHMKNHHGGVVLVNGHLYGFDSGILTCLDFMTGTVKWRDRSVGKGSVTYADGDLYVLSENGIMGLVRANPEKYEEINRFKLGDRSKRPTWTYPVIAHGRLYLRDQERIRCYDVAAK